MLPNYYYRGAKLADEILLIAMAFADILSVFGIAFCIYAMRQGAGTPPSNGAGKKIFQGFYKGLFLIRENFLGNILGVGSFFWKTMSACRLSAKGK